MADHKDSRSALFIDGGVFEFAARGNRDAIRALAREAAAYLAPTDTPTDDDTARLLAWVADALAKIADGTPPDRAFRWSTGHRPPANRTLLEWTIAREVADLHATGIALLDAFSHVGAARGLDGDKSGYVEKAYYRFKDVEVPPDPFPIESDPPRRRNRDPSR